MSIKKIGWAIVCLIACVILCSCGGDGKTIEAVSRNITAYTMDITYNDDHTLAVDQTVDYVNNEGEDIGELYFHLYPKSFNMDATHRPVGVLNKAKAYYNGDSEGDIEIKNVKVASDVVAMTYVGDDEDFLKIELKDKVANGGKLKISMQYVVTIPNCNHRFGYGESTINLGNFYPVLAVYDNGEYSLNSYHSNGDPFYSDIANYKVTITSPEAYTIASTGKMMATDNKDGVKTSTYEAKAVRDYAFVLSDKFEVATSKIEGVDVMYYYYDDENWERNLQASVDSVVTFNELFGKYPYSTLSVVKANFVHGGMEYPNLVYISDAVTEELDYINVIVHEIAHQWWYGLVGNDEYVNSWLDEGLTEFSTNLFYENNPSYNVDAKEIVKNITKSYTNFVEIYSSVLGDVDTTMNRRLDEYNSEPEYVYITYVKGNLFFNTLRDTIGKDKFMKGLRKYFEDNKFAIANPDKMLEAFSSVTKIDLKPFFDSWINGKVDIVEP